MNPFGIGGKPRPKDERDYSIPLGSATPFPSTFSSPVTTIYNQGKFGTCGAHAGAQLANILFGATTSPKFLWKMIKTIDGFPLDAGTDMRSIFKALQKFGTCDYSLMPNPDNYDAISLEQYSDVSEVNPAISEDAATRKISSYSFTDYPSIAQIKQAVYQYKAALLLVDIGDAWWANGWQDSAVNPLKVGNFVGHHFILASEYGFTLIDGPNSWSRAWGKNGFFDFDQSFIPHILEMGIATVEVTKPEPKFQFVRDLVYKWIAPMWGSDVYKLQEILIAEGCGDFKPTGIYYTKTFEAVKKYQIKHGITPVTGNVGPKTRAVLNT